MFELLRYSKQNPESPGQDVRIASSPLHTQVLLRLVPFPEESELRGLTENKVLSSYIPGEGG